MTSESGKKDQVLYSEMARAGNFRALLRKGKQRNCHANSIWKPHKIESPGSPFLPSHVVANFFCVALSAAVSPRWR